MKFFQVLPIISAPFSLAIIIAVTDLIPVRYKSDSEIKQDKGDVSDAESQCQEGWTFYASVRFKSRVQRRDKDKNSKGILIFL